MAERIPAGELDTRFSSEEATVTDWSQVDRALEAAEIYWLATVRADGQPNVSPLIGLWHDGAFWFATGTEEQKARNLARNPRCTITTGANAYGEGLDVVIEGSAVRETDDGVLQRIADLYVAKYSEEWRFTPRNGAFYHGEGTIREDDPGAAHVFTVRPAKALAFARGAQYSQTRWRFA